jgi:hypothetical protein
MPPNLRLVHDANEAGALLPRGAAHGLASWPKCMQCRRPVDAYGIGEHVPGKYIEVWLRCDGIAGQEGGRHARSYRSGIRVDLTRLPAAWSYNLQTNILARLMLKPGKFSKWNVVFNHPDAVVPR